LIVLDSSAVVDYPARLDPGDRVVDVEIVSALRRFVALAEWLNADLLTTDARLARAPGIRATVLTP
jgi:predicted nucleic acid-binding protein